jgi:hypothetical protein
MGYKTIIPCEVFMSEATCLFCEKPEKNFKPARGVDFVCSHCVMAFLSSDQDYLKWVHDQAIKNSMPDKARAIESFIIKEVVDGKQFNPKSRKRHARKYFNRRGNSKADRLEKITTRSIAKQRKVSISEGERKQPALS